MKNLLILSCSLLFLNVSAQDHFSGINTSRRVGLLNVGINPAELTNLTSKYEVNLFSISGNVSNNKIGFDDLTGDKDLEDLIYEGDEPVNMRVDAEIYGPGFVMRTNKWGFGVTSKAYVKLTLVDISPDLGKALNTNTVGGTTTISNDYNERINGTTWGEIGLSASRNLFEDEKYKFSAGLTLKLLFPGSYVNLGLDKFQGTISNNAGQAYVNNATATLNVAYSGNLAQSFTDSSDYTQSVFGSLNGFAADFGANYQLKDKDKGNYKLNSGIAIRNIGSMTFKGDNNSATNYDLDIQSTVADPFGLNLSEFDNVNSLEEVETILRDKGYLTTTPTNSDFKVKLPAVFSAYVDYKIVPTFYVSIYTQQKLGDDSNNNQATTQNVISLTPRYSLKNFEVYVPISSNEISGTTGGFGFRLYGFYLGSSSVITALTSNTKQADFYFGYRLGLK